MTAVSTSSKPNSISSMPSLHQTPSQPVTTVSGSPSSTLVEAPTPLLVTPGQLLQSAPSKVSSVQSSQIVEKDVEVVKVSQKASPGKPAQSRLEAQPPLLPLPSPARSQKPNGSHFQPRQNYRGRGGRGGGMSRPVTKFIEEFDFMAMDEKFKKEEVWGDLGRSNKSQDINGFDDEDEAHEEDEIESPKVDDRKSGYNKDDFFDNLSCNAIDNDPNHGSMKLDTETFGEFSRYRGSRGGRGAVHGVRITEEEDMAMGMLIEVVVVAGSQIVAGSQVDTTRTSPITYDILANKVVSIVHQDWNTRNHYVNCSVLFLVP